MEYSKKLEDLMRKSIAAKEEFLADETQLKVFQSAASLLLSAYKNGGRLYIAGNGGSAADAQHIAAELVCRLARDRKPLPAEAMTTDSSILTAIGNDYGYENLFSRQVEGKMTKGDVFLGITTSGKSENINKALKKCRELGFSSIVLTGHDGGEARGLADYCIVAKGDLTSTIQEQHIVIGHALCASIEDSLFPKC